MRKKYIWYILYFNKDWSKVLKLSYILYMSFNKDVYACLQRVFKNTEKTAMLQTSLEMWLIIMGCCSCQLKNWSLVMLSLFPSNVIKGIPSNQDRQLEMLNFKNINLFILTSHIIPPPKNKKKNQNVILWYLSQRGFWDWSAAEFH